METLKLLPILFALSAPLYAAPPVATSSPLETIKANWGTIDAQGLEALMESKVPMVLIDARTDEWFDGTLIQGAQRLPVNASKEDIKNIIPNKNQLVIVYCGGAQCPASKLLAKRLGDEGYKNIIDYHGGIKEWTALHKPTQKI